MFIVLGFCSALLGWRTVLDEFQKFSVRSFERLIILLSFSYTCETVLIKNIRLLLLVLWVEIRDSGMLGKHIAIVLCV